MFLSKCSTEAGWYKKKNFHHLFKWLRSSSVKVFTRKVTSGEWYGHNELLWVLHQSGGKVHCSEPCSLFLDDVTAEMKKGEWQKDSSKKELKRPLNCIFLIMVGFVSRETSQPQPKLTNIWFVVTVKVSPQVKWSTVKRSAAHTVFVWNGNAVKKVKSSFTVLSKRGFRGFSLPSGSKRLCKKRQENTFLCVINQSYWFGFPALCCTNTTKWSVVWFEVAGTVKKCSLCDHRLCESPWRARKSTRMGNFETWKGERQEAKREERSRRWKVCRVCMGAFTSEGDADSHVESVRCWVVRSWRRLNRDFHAVAHRSSITSVKLQH